MKLLLCKLILSCTLAGPDAKPADELAYGTVLYAYFQEDYQQAMLETLVAEAQDRRGEDPVRFELAKGSFAFSDGMYGFASEIFAQVDPGELTELDQLRLAFHLSREHHRRLDWNALEPQLAKIELGKSWLGRLKHHPEVEFMRSELAIHKGEFDQARAHLALLDVKEPMRAYGLYNLGVALRDQDSAAAADAFRELGDTPAYNAETFDLVQRAKLAQAFLAREQSERKDAVAVLKDLPGSGRYRDTALAAYASLAMDAGDYELAARIWMTLQEQEYWTPSTAAARLGFPLSLENLASQEMALQQYRVAEQSFSARLTALETLTDRAQDPAWIRTLLATFSTPEPDEQKMGELMQNWQQELGHTDWLEWLSSEEVHDVLLQWRSLVKEQSWLAQIPDQLDAFAEIADERRRRSQVAKSRLSEDELLNNRDVLFDNVQQMSERLALLNAAQAEPSSEWLHALANPEERKRIAKLDKMATMIQQHFSHQGVANSEWQPWLQRIARLRGLTFWDIATSKQGRVRVLEKQLAEAQALLFEVDDRVARVERAEAQFVAGVETDFLGLDQQARELMVRVDSAVVEREEQLAQQIRKGMERERQQVRGYLLVTRVAIARASDQLANARGGDASVPDIAGMEQP